MRETPLNGWHGPWTAGELVEAMHIELVPAVCEWLRSSMLVRALPPKATLPVDESPRKKRPAVAEAEKPVPGHAPLK